MARTPRVALVTCAQLPDLDPDDQLALPALEAAGVEAVPMVWSDPEADWSAFDAVVIRSTWDYSDRRGDYLAWAHRVQSQSLLLNSAPTVAWNTDKRYLRALTGAGVPVVPTTFLESPDDLASLALARGTDVVVKPAVSCGSRDTIRHAADDAEAIRAHAAELLQRGRAVMVQPYLDAVDTSGESALMFLGGRFSHAIRKGPLLVRGIEGRQEHGLYVDEQIDPREPGPDELDVAERALDAVPGGRDALLYARVDVIRDADGAPCLLELELTEPSLFLGYSAGAAGRLAAAIATRLA